MQVCGLISTFTLTRRENLPSHHTCHTTQGGVSGVTCKAIIAQSENHKKLIKIYKFILLFEVALITFIIMHVNL